MCMMYRGSVQLLAEALGPRQPVTFNIRRRKNALGAPDQQMTRHEAEITEIAAVVPVVAQHDELIVWYLNRAEIVARDDAGQPLHDMRVPSRTFVQVQRRYCTTIGKLFFHYRHR